MMTGAVDRPQAPRNLLVAGHEPLPAVHHEDHKVGRCNSFAAVLDDQLVQRVSWRRTSRRYRRGEKWSPATRPAGRCASRVVPASGATMPGACR